MFYSTQMEKSFMCEIREFLREYIFLIVLVVVAMCYAWWKLSQCFYERKVYGASRDLYLQVREDLKGMGRTISGVSEPEMMRKFMAWKGGNIKRDESTFKSLVMPELERIRKSERQIITIERMQHGRPVQVWQLK